MLNHIQQGLSQSLIYLPEVGNSYFASYDLITKHLPLAAAGYAIPGMLLWEQVYPTRGPSRKSSHPFNRMILPWLLPVMVALTFN